MEIGIRFESIWSDNDVLEVRITAWNGQFGGSADVYVEIGGILKAVGKLEGFPRHSADFCDFELGAFGSGFAGGGANFHFYIRDLAGHSFIELTIESDYDQFNQAQRTTLRAPVEAAAIDSFVAELRSFEEQLYSVAFLKLGAG